MEGREDVAFVFGRKLRAVIKAQVERCRMALHENVGDEDFAGEFRMFSFVPRVLVIPKIEPRPAIESAALHATDVIRHEVLAELVPLVRAHPKLVRARAELDPDGVPDSPCENI